MGNGAAVAKTKQKREFSCFIALFLYLTLAGVGSQLAQIRNGCCLCLVLWSSSCRANHISTLPLQRKSSINVICWLESWEVEPIPLLDWA
jgi:hypothetical protein